MLGVLMSTFEYMVYDGGAKGDKTFREIGRFLNDLAVNQGNLSNKVSTPRIAKDYIEGLNKLGELGWMAVGFTHQNSDQLLLMRIKSA